MKQHLLITLTLFCYSLLSFGQDFTDNGINYTITSATTVKVGTNNVIGVANIPSTVNYNSNTYSVTSIGAFSFAIYQGLTAITIPNSVTTIEDYAFLNCVNLTTVTLPNSLISIGANAFNTCTSLISIELPNSITNIGNTAFYNCNSLTSLTLSNSLVSIGEETFSFCSNLNSVIIPNSVNSIGVAAFKNCYNLNSVSITNSITNIGDDAFSNCYALTSFTVNWLIPLSVNANVFAGTYIGGAILNVPAGTAGLYDAAPVWTDFGTTLGTNSFTNTNFKAYPNPTTGLITISNSDEIYEASVYNMLGQNVFTQKGNGLSLQIDLSNLEAQTYFVKVTSEGTTKTFKVLKQ